MPLNRRGDLGAHAKILDYSDIAKNDCHAHNMPLASLQNSVEKCNCSWKVHVAVYAKAML